MAKRINELTKEQEARMSEWRDKWIAKGLQTGETDWATFDTYMPICFEKAGIPYPKNVVRVSSPLVGALAAPIANEIIKKQGLKSDSVSGAVRDAVGGAVDDAVRDAVRVAVRDAVRVAVRDAVDDAVDDTVRVAVRVAVRDAVRVAVRVAVGDAVDDAVRDAVRVAKLNWHHWLGGQFWVGGWWGSPCYVSFFREVCGLELSKDNEERAIAYQRVCESVNYIWPNRHFIIVCARPKRISRNIQGLLHSDTNKAIEYPDGWGIYALNGVRFPEALWKEVISGNMPFEKILAIEDIDQRTQAMKYGDVNKFIKHLKGEQLDTYQKFLPTGEPIYYTLYRFPKGDTFTLDAYYMLYQCPSTFKDYMSGVVASKSVPEAMAWKLQTTEEEWKQLVPLVTES